MTRDLDTYILFKKVRAECIFLSRKCYREYLRQVEHNIRGNPKSFWNFVNESRSERDIPAAMTFDGETVTGRQQVVNLFAEYFSSVYGKSNQQPCSAVFVGGETNLTKDMSIKVEDLETTLSKLTPRVSVGPDGIPAIFLKNCAKSISLPLYLLFNGSLKKGCFPEVWKTTYISPLYKEGDKNNVRNYRPISTLNAIPALFDSLVYKIFYSRVSHLLSESQHGFVKGRTVVTNLFELSAEVTSAIKKNSQVDALYLDFSKAFDKVCHTLLINKLYDMEIRGTFLSWLHSYLCNRIQSVVVDGYVSAPFHVTSGVAQGSNLGPLLFVLFVNDLTEVISDASVALFADDTKIFKTISCQNDCEVLQRNAEMLVHWTRLNKLPLNLGKCKTISFGLVIKHEYDYKLGDTNVSRVDSWRDLGVIVDSCWTFEPHMQTVLSKSNRMLGFVKRTTKDFNQWKTCTQLFKSLVQPHLLYASVIWSPATTTKMSALEAVVRKFLKYASRKTQNLKMSYCDHDYGAISKLTNTYTIQSQHRVNDLLFVGSSIKGDISCTNVKKLFMPREMQRELRDHRPLLEEGCSGNLIFNTAIYRLRREYNSLQQEIRSMEEYTSFKTQIKRDYLEQYK